MLSEREAPVMRMRFGLTDGQPRTLDEIGRIQGVTRERIRSLRLALDSIWRDATHPPDRAPRLPLKLTPKPHRQPAPHRSSRLHLDSTAT